MRLYGADANRYVHTIRSTQTQGDEHYYRQYDVKVQAFNDMGLGPESPSVTIRSAEDSKCRGGSTETPTCTMKTCLTEIALRLWWMWLHQRIWHEMWHTSTRLQISTVFDTVVSDLPQA